VPQLNYLAKYAFGHVPIWLCS